MEKRVISTQIQEEDLKIEKSLRPQTLSEYIGQEKAKENLKVYIEAAKNRGESLDHVLFYGPPGLGKYAALERDYPVSGGSLTQAELQRFYDILEQEGITNIVKE